MFQHQMKLNPLTIIYYLINIKKWYILKMLKQVLKQKKILTIYLLLQIWEKFTIYTIYIKDYINLKM